MLNRIVLRENDRWLEFTEPLEVRMATRAGEVPGVLEFAQEAVARGFTVAGFVTYEAAHGFDSALETRAPGRLPLACFGAYRDATDVETLSAPNESHSADWQLTASREAYAHSIRQIKQQIELGNTYQINFTLRLGSEDPPDPWPLFVRIASDAPYAAYVELDDAAIVSASPELFFTLDGNSIHCRPMKGTAARGMTTAEDRLAAATLEHSVKNRAENVMITDMIRNDLGRVADAGTVQVDSLYALEKYPTVWQMTSSVSATTQASLAEIFAALFPCASVTGAPKASSMHIIAELEDSPREVYTGSIGYLAPGRKAQFNVAIRTAVIDTRDNSGSYGVGSGIVWDSDADDEYDECLVKASVLDSPAVASGFELLETILWDREDGWFLLDYHLDRIQDSAEYFDYAFKRDAIDALLRTKATAFDSSRARVRLLLSRDGTAQLQSTALPRDAASAVRIGIADSPIDRRDPFIFHKTTHRAVYEEPLRRAGNVDDVLLWNSEGFITETTIANVVVDIGGERVTPPVSDGLLGGVYRRWLLEKGEITERSIHLDELAGVGEITLVNSVRGMYPALLQAARRRA